jgi:hypothetical protein
VGSDVVEAGVAVEAGVVVGGSVVVGCMSGGALGISPQAVKVRLRTTRPR